MYYARPSESHSQGNDPKNPRLTAAGLGLNTSCENSVACDAYECQNPCSNALRGSGVPANSNWALMLIVRLPLPIGWGNPEAACISMRK